MDLSVLKEYLGDDPLLSGFVGLVVITIVVMLLTRKPKGPGGRR